MPFELEVSLEFQICFSIKNPDYCIGENKIELQSLPDTLLCTNGITLSSAISLRQQADQQSHKTRKKRETDLKLNMVYFKG